MRISPGLARTIVVAIFLFSVVSGFETGAARYAELEAQARGVYAAALAQHHIGQHGSCCTSCSPRRLSPRHSR